MKPTIAFSKWSTAWQQAFESKENVLVLKAWKLDPPANRLRNDPNLPRAGYRRGNSKGLRGEQHIEKALLGEFPETPLVPSSIEKGRYKHSIRAYYNHLPLVGLKEQTYPDVFGVIETSEREPHTLAIEVKVTDHDCWYAVVENLRQIRLLRANIPYQEQLLKKVGVTITKGISGTWGLVLAPEKFYIGSTRLQKAFDKGLALIKMMEQAKTEARVMLGVWGPEGAVIQHKDGYWPR